MTPPTPDRIGRYPVQAVLGAGAFATVYRARDARLGSDVAVKVLAENHAFDADLRERFVLEGQLLRRMASPHILAVHDIGENERAQPYLVLELADRGDLRTRIEAARRDGRRPNAEDLTQVCRSVAGAMEVLHASEVVHRDLAPGNLLLVSPDATVPSRVHGDGIVAADERVVVADLGLSKDLARASGLTVGTGTAGFTPPEQRTAGGWVDVRADIWSASALLVWLVTADAPDEAGRWRRIFEDAGWPFALAEVLTQGLAQDPTDRPATASAWRDAVVEAVAPPPTGAGVVLKRVPSWRARLAWVAVAVVVVAGSVFGGWLLRGSDGATSEVTDLGGGRAQAVEAADGIRVEVTGPSTVEVGETARFEATVEGTAAAYWVTADGESYPASSAVDITPSSTGRGAVVLFARNAEGEVVDVTFSFDVEESS